MKYKSFMFFLGIVFFASSCDPMKKDAEKYVKQYCGAKSCEETFRKFENSNITMKDYKILGNHYIQANERLSEMKEAINKKYKFTDENERIWDLIDKKIKIECGK